jgi:hypothetical protein
VDNFRIRSESESELCEYGEEFLISMQMWNQIVCGCGLGYGVSDIRRI